MDNEKDPSHIIKVHDVALAVQFAPFHWCSSLLAVGTFSRVVIFTIKLPEDDNDIDDISAENVRTFQHGSSVSIIAWSPQTNLMTTPKVLKFAVAGGDRKITVFTSDVKTEDTECGLEGHTDLINDLAFEPESGEHLASVSDDHTCCIWSLDGTISAKILLTSPGVTVAWHRDDPGKLIVAEKKGIIRFYNVTTRNPVLSLDCRTSPLLQADWCSLDSLKIGCVAENAWFLWDTSVSSCPSTKKLNHYREGGVKFAFSKTNPNLIATRGNPNTLKVENIKTNQELLCASFLSGSGVSWHAKSLLVAAGGDRKVCLWKMDLL